MSNIIQALEQREMKQDIPTFGIGDTIRISTEGFGARQQNFEGVVIARRNRGLHSAVTVRKISHGVGVERVFHLHSPMIKNIELRRRGKVRKAKLYYLRALSGKKARIEEDLSKA